MSPAGVSDCQITTAGEIGLADVIGVDGWIGAWRRCSCHESDNTRQAGISRVRRKHGSKRAAAVDCQRDASIDSRSLKWLRCAGSVLLIPQSVDRRIRSDDVSHNPGRSRYPRCRKLSHSQPATSRLEPSFLL